MENLAGSRLAMMVTDLVLFGSQELWPYTMASDPLTMNTDRVGYVKCQSVAGTPWTNPAIGSIGANDPDNQISSCT